MKLQADKVWNAKDLARHRAEVNAALTEEALTARGGTDEKVLRLYYRAGLPSRDVAKVIGVTQAAVEHRRYRVLCEMLLDVIAGRKP